MGYMFNARGYKTGGSGWNLKGCKGFLIIASVVTLGQVAIIEIPFLNNFFNVESLLRINWQNFFQTWNPIDWNYSLLLEANWSDWLYIFGLGFLVTGVREVYAFGKKLL
jgi:Ca2+-transporting ATPase